MDKNKLLKTLAALALIVVLFSALSRVLAGRSLTLAEYAAQKSREAAESRTAETLSGGDGTDGKEEPSAGTAAPGSTDIPAEGPPVPEGTPSGTEREGAAAPEGRFVYEEAFYYEPLSQEATAGITGASYPEEGTDDVSPEDLRYVHVLHYNFDGETVPGELICNEAIASDLVEIFYELYRAEYRIEKISLIDGYGGDDLKSMEDNNTSCFNYRNVPNTSRLSKHALGLAVDINPLYNPYVTYDRDGAVSVAPEGGRPYADREAQFPYKIDDSDLCYRLFTEHGFIWGGNWNSCKDYQHFQKTP